MANHLSITHPTRLPFLCERSENKEARDPEPGQVLPTPSSIESTSLKHIKQMLNPRVFRASSSLIKDQVDLMNLKNIGNLGSKIQLIRNANGFWHEKAPVQASIPAKKVQQSPPTIPKNTRFKISPGSETVERVIKISPQVKNTSSKPLQLQIKNVFSLASKKKP